MDKDLNKLKKTILLMKKEGVLYLKTPDGIEINLSPAFLGKVSRNKRTEKADHPVSQEPSDEEKLFWSSHQFAGAMNG